MEFVTNIFSIYQQLYNEGTDEYWDSIAERVGYSSEIVKQIYGPKDSEFEILQNFVTEYLSDKITLRTLLEQLGDQNVDLLSIDALRMMFVEILNNIDREEIEEILEDEEAYCFSVGLAEGILINLEEVLVQMFQEGFYN